MSKLALSDHIAIFIYHVHMHYISHAMYGIKIFNVHN